MNKETMNEIKQLIGDATHFAGVNIEKYSDVECLQDMKKMSEKYEDMGIQLSEALHRIQELETIVKNQNSSIGFLNNILDKTMVAIEEDRIDGCNGCDIYTIELNGSVVVESEVYNTLNR